MRAAIFIDGGYLLKQLQDAKVNPDYSRIAEFLLKPLRRNTQLDLMRCYFYYCPPWMSEKPTEAELRRMATHERFMAEMQEGCDRWQVRLGKLERRREGDKEVFAQKRVDVQLSVDLVQHSAAGHIQHAVLVAGDSDFIPAIVAAKESGTTLTLWCDRDRSVHRDLLKLADEVHYIRWRDFPSRPFPETRSDSQRHEVRSEQRVEPRTEVRLDPRLEARVPDSRIQEPLGSSPHETQDAAPALESDIRTELHADVVAVAVDGETPKKKRGRRRGSGKGNATSPTPVKISGEVAAPAAAAAASTTTTSLVRAAVPVAHQIPDQAPSAKPRARSQPRPSTKVATTQPVAATEVQEEAGADTGNRVEASPTGAAKPGRRRRGGRGRRRKTAPGGPTSGEP